MKIKTHKFRLGKYHIEFGGRFDGATDVPDARPWNEQIHLMQILDGNSFKSLNSALHEAMHAEGIPDKYLHTKDGYSDTERLTRFLWRLGYRKVGDK